MVEEDTPVLSEVSTNDDPAPDIVVAIEDDFPLVGFLEEVDLAPEAPVSISESSQDVGLSHKSTSEPESPQAKVIANTDPVLERNKSTPEPDSPRQRKSLSRRPGGSSRIPALSPSSVPSLPKIKAKSLCELSTKQYSGSESVVSYEKIKDVLLNHDCEDTNENSVVSEESEKTKRLVVNPFFSP